MSLIRFVRLLIEFKWLVILLPITLAATVFRLTKNEVREYTANSLLYTGLASGYNIESSGATKIDNVTVSNAFDNLFNTMKSKSSMEEVGLRLLAQHIMLTKPDSAVASKYTFGKLREVLSEKEIRALADSTYEKTLQNVYDDIIKPESKIAKVLMGAEKGIYSGPGILSRFSVNRQNNSDMVQISYSASDPAVVKKTLELITHVVIGKYKQIKIHETGNVVAYFEEQLRNVSAKLKNSEDKLTNFSSQNRIINYYEQTKMVTVKDGDLEERIQALISEIESNRAVLRDLENKIGFKDDLVAKSKKFASLRDSINFYTTRLTLMEFESKPREQEIAQVRERLNQLENKFKSNVIEYYELSNTKTGIPAKMYFSEWINATISIDKSQARLLILKDIKHEYDLKYDRFAPLGSTVSRYEREIGVIEKEYLSILGSLNLSKIREQNLMMSINLRVIDPPIYPTKAEPSKRSTLIVAAFMAGLILVIVSIIGREFLDNSLKHPVKAEKEIGVPFVGALPLVDPQKHNILFNVIETYTLNQCISRLKRLNGDNIKIPKLVLLCSTRKGEGKSYFISKLCSKLNESGAKSVWLNPHNYADGDFAYAYTLRGNFASTTSLNDVDITDTFDDCEYIFFELPPLISHPIPVNLVKQAAFTLILADSTRVWDSADQYVFQTYTENTQNPIGLLLNKVKHDFLEGIIGEIPKVRSWFRRKFKDLLIKRHQSKRTNVKLKYEMLKKEEESAWFTENGLTDFVETRVEIPDAVNRQSRIKAEKGKSLGYYRVLQKRRYRWIKIAAGLGTMGFVGICALYLFWKTTPESQYEKFTDFVVGNQVDSLAKVRSTRLVPNLDSIIIDPSQLESIPDSVRHDSVKTLIRQKEIQP
ncbi:GumC family protein [Flectobacillus roseus]